MKCIKRTDSEKVERLPDDVAHRLVADGAAHYCPKHCWKAQGRKRTHSPTPKEG